MNKIEPIFHDVEQNTDEWMYLRSGKFTASAISNLLMGKNTKGYKDTIKKCAIERLSGEPTEESFFGNGYTDRGHELEPLAVKAYEELTFCECTNGGFYELPESDGSPSFVGASPDRVIKGEDGLLECKCLGYKAFVDYLFSGEEEIKKDYNKQCQSQIFVSGKAWVDLVIFYPGYQIIKVRILPDPMMQAQIETEIKIAKNAVKGLMQKLVEFRLDKNEPLITE